MTPLEDDRLPTGPMKGHVPEDGGEEFKDTGYFSEGERAIMDDGRVLFKSKSPNDHNPRVVNTGLWVCSKKGCWELYPSEDHDAYADHLEKIHGDEAYPPRLVSLFEEIAPKPKTVRKYSAKPLGKLD